MTKAGEACDPPAAWKELYVAWEGPCPAAGGGAGRAGSCQPTAVPCSPVTAPGCRPCLWVWEPSFDDGILQEGVSLYPSLGLGCTFRFRLGPENPRPVGTSPICPPGTPAAPPGMAALAPGHTPLFPPMRPQCALSNSEERGVTSSRGIPRPLRLGAPALWSQPPPLSTSVAPISGSCLFLCHPRQEMRSLKARTVSSLARHSQSLGPGTCV